MHGRARAQLDDHTEYTTGRHRPDAAPIPARTIPHTNSHPRQHNQTTELTTESFRVLALFGPCAIVNSHAATTALPQLHDAARVGAPARCHAR